MSRLNLVLKQICAYSSQEPPLGDFKGQPQCIADQQASCAGNPHTLGGTLFRVTSCEILYGPLNCGFVLSGQNWWVLSWYQCLSQYTDDTSARD